MSAPDEEALDRYEGYPAFYFIKTRMRLPVKEIGADGIVTKNVFLYIMHEDRPLGMPTLRCMNTCLDVYQGFGFDRRGLMEAYDKKQQIGGDGMKEESRREAVCP